MAIASDDVINLAKGHQVFTTSLYKELCHTHPNLAFCPTIICAALTMMGIGAKGDTALQLASVVNLQSVDVTSQVHSIFTRLIATMTYKNPHPECVEMIIANALYAPKHYLLVERFSKVLADRYFASTHNTDFQSDKDVAANDINTWFANQTRNKITTMVAPSSFDKSTKVVLLNAVYMRGLWESKFSHEKTSLAPFYLLDGTERQVEMMYQDGYLRCWYNDSLHCRVLDMPYKGGVFTMDIILPDNSDAFQALEETLSVEIIERLLDSVGGQHDVNLWLPRFKIDLSTKLHEFLPHLGVINMFSEDSADLSGLCNETLHVSAMLHRTVLAVDEFGTESGNGTGYEFDPDSWRPQPVDFNANRPFLYLIRHKKTNTIFLIGRFTSP